MFIRKSNKLHYQHSFSRGANFGAKIMHMHACIATYKTYHLNFFPAKAYSAKIIGKTRETNGYYRFMQPVCPVVCILYQSFSYVKLKDCQKFKKKKIL